MALFTPVNQVRLTNVSVVRLKKGGDRFEIACYPNKVMPWRQKIEKDIDEVLQSELVFTNVSKGVLAKKGELKKAFGTEDVKTVILEILAKGEIQVNEKERQVLNEKLFRDIATVVAEKCVDPETKRPLTVSLVERAMKDLHYSVNEKKNAKVQALDVIKLLKGKIPIERAQMKLKIHFPTEDSAKIKEQLAKLVKVEKEEASEERTLLVCLIDPGNFRNIDEIIKKGKGGIEVLNLAVTEEGEAKVQ